ncbi:hypothetical protein PHAMO_220089 [Magnetospirillum molischianum DSM 120]|uniref:Tryptophan synthase beta chain-like PALP domain-containing protein n=1 Tax=Magnetospirillum molischianum DSM 120 TaxID=1150626 RepID=H8FRI3_MAGML|nr:pyridoxal-phosphate dependent enzyme [Magnetospirillum molischianum]CCG40971.1 hypothetical protein PHAMO_220089 [Magnetospirillum molischianum DSM 120]
MEKLVRKNHDVVRMEMLRLAHACLTDGREYADRLSSAAFMETGIDIHPAARIGARLVIDHGWGSVIGEDCYILGCAILGARGISNNPDGKRPPTVRLDRFRRGLSLESSFYLKLEQMNPGGSHKVRIAVNMILDAERRGLLRRGGKPDHHRGDRLQYRAGAGAGAGGQSVRLPAGAGRPRQLQPAQDPAAGGLWRRGPAGRFAPWAGYPFRAGA